MMRARSLPWYLTWSPLPLFGAVAVSILVFGLLMNLHLRLSKEGGVAWWRSGVLCTIACCAGALPPGLIHLLNTMPECLPRCALHSFMIECCIRTAMPSAALFACATLLRHLSSRQQIRGLLWFWPACSAASGFTFTIVPLILLRFGHLPLAMFGHPSINVLEVLIVLLSVCLCALMAGAGLVVHLRAWYGVRCTFACCAKLTLSAAVFAALLYVLCAVSGAHRSTLSVGGMIIYPLLVVALGAVMYAAFVLSLRLLPAREHACVCTFWTSIGAGSCFGFVSLLFQQLLVVS